MTPTLPPRPPDGTYVYQASAGIVNVITDRVVIRTVGNSIVVTDAANVTIQNASGLVTETFDAATLNETGYAADFTLPSGTQHADVTFTPGTLTIKVPGQSVPVAADPSAPFEITGDNLADSVVLMLAALHAHGASSFTVALLHGGTALVSHVTFGVTATRPAGVPPADSAATLSFGSNEQTFWYDPATYTIDDIEIPGQNARIRLVSRALGNVAPPTPAPVATPVPTPPPHFTSTDVTFASLDGTRLAGTLTVPQGTAARRYPAIVLVNGSGAVNRDEAVGPNAPFLQLSNALSNAGFVVLRYDKRGIGQSGGSFAHVTRPQLLEDVRAAWHFLASQSTVDARHVFLLGHSEGGELVPSVAAGSRALGGIVLMAPPALPLSQVIMEQVLESVPASQRALTRSEELAALDDIRHGTTHTVAVRGMSGNGVAWLRSSLDIDPAVDIARVRVPILILQGGSDVQVLPKDLPRLVRAARRANADVSVHVFPGDNHLFMAVTHGEALTPQAAARQYVTVPGYVDAAVLRALVAWLQAKSL